MASLPENELTDTLLSVDRFCEPHLSRLPSATRRELLIRLGLFGVRRCIEALGRTPEMTATDLARLLRDVSGIGTLVQLLDTHFATRARALKAQSAVVGLRRLARSLKETDPDAALTIEASAEELWTTAHDFSLLRLIQIIAADPQIIDDEEADEVRRLTSGGSFADRLGTQQGVPTDRLLEVAAGRINHWRERAGHPLIEQPAAEACDLIIRAYEAIHTEIADNGE
jgi:hypothetical protein